MDDLETHWQHYTMNCVGKAAAISKKQDLVEYHTVRVQSRPQRLPENAITLSEEETERWKRLSLAYGREIDM